MSPVDYIKIPAAVLQERNLCAKQKMLLGLIISFDSKGLRMSNDEIGKLLMLNPDYVSQLISDLETKMFIKITGAQSKYRKIYFEKNLKVQSDLLLEKSQSKENLLLEKPKHTLRNFSNITKRTKERKRIAFNSTSGEFSEITQDDFNRWAKAYPGINIQAEIAKAGDWLIRKDETRTDYRKFLANWFGRCKPIADVLLPEPDTDAILGKLGYTPAQIEQVKAEGLSV